MKTAKLFIVVAALVCATTAWAQTKVSTDDELRSAITDGANITVTADIELSNSTLSIPEGTKVTINLGGFTLDRKLTERGEGGGQVITVRSGATLNLSNGTLKGGWGGNAGGIANEAGTANLTNVNITGCTGDDKGGAICNLSGGTLTMKGGSITGNTSFDKDNPTGGGGLFNAAGATATLTGVTISGNTAKVKGGGAICNYGTMTLDGCTITGNTCGKNGGGIYNYSTATLNIQGAMTVTGNMGPGGMTNNLFLKTGAVVTITGSLAGSTVGLNMEATTGTFTSGYNTYNSGVDPATLFFSDLPMTVYVTSTGTEAQMAYETEVSYIKCSWDEDNKQLISETKTLHEGNYTLLTSGGDISLASGYYVVRGTVSRSTIDLTGGHTVHLILCDGAKLTANYIHLEYDEYHTGTGDRDSLYIYSQSYGGKMGKLRVDNSGTITDAGIGTGYARMKTSPSMGALIVHGGDIYSKGGTNAAGIGGGHGGRGGRVYVYGGRVEAHGGEGAGTNSGGGAGIGSGYFAPAGAVWVYGGEVYAYGGQDAAGIGSGDAGNVMQHDFDKWVHAGWFTMYGGYVEAHGGGNGAGIGGGEYSPGPKDVSIYGGTVKAYGGEDAAGIGGGYYTMDYGISTGYVNIYGGEVYAYGADEGAGIGGGENGDGAKVKILGGTVVAQAGENETGYKAIGPGRDSDDYGELTLGDNLMVSSERMASAAERHDMCWYRTRVRIEPCDHSHVTYTVSGTGPDDTHLKHCNYCTTTFKEEKHKFVNDVCTVCGVTETTETHTVSIYQPVEGGAAYDENPNQQQVIDGDKFKLPVAPNVEIPNNLDFAGWLVGTPPNMSDIITDGTETLLPAGTGYTVDADVSFAARYDYIHLTLNNATHNGEMLARYNGKQAQDLTLKDRTLYRDGSWNTLCLPFDISSFEGSPLKGATVKTLSSTSFNNGTLTLNFSDDVTTIEAGKPYIIKWASGDNITDPVFNNVTISTALNPVETTAAEGITITFAGAYSPMFLGMERKNILYLGADNTLYYPNAAMTIGSCRGHFRLEGIEAGDPTSGVREFVMNIEDSETNGISSLSPNSSTYREGGWYTIDGRRLSGKPTAKGVYINKGRLVVNK